jgi:hypothetical protein
MRVITQGTTLRTLPVGVLTAGVKASVQIFGFRQITLRRLMTAAVTLVDGNGGAVYA